MMIIINPDDHGRVSTTHLGDCLLFGPRNLNVLETVMKEIQMKVKVISLCLMVRRLPKTQLTSLSH